jgi:hypothetical protein
MGPQAVDRLSDRGHAGLNLDLEAMGARGGGGPRAFYPRGGGTKQLGKNLVDWLKARPSLE